MILFDRRKIIYAPDVKARIHFRRQGATSRIYKKGARVSAIRQNRTNPVALMQIAL